ncbi:hypothetical protein CWS20_22010 [Cytobacillus horneckiae]|uniref:Uncharacterized protein n=3 Tax=Bacillati TaxID=1783272 RepID=A0A2N0ZBD1_9BACI|nr:hypothetical protein [Cytobacillus horneckiae]MEC1158665.1 hypothetical protein [Cytobacillus horneckiae]PKG26822.1 hypothetical protein CWS20_22010 [Cytobacillus horneckiae]
MELMEQIHKLQDILREHNNSWISELALDYPHFYLEYKDLREKSLKELSPHQYFQIANCAYFLFPFELRSIYNYLFNIDSHSEKEKILNCLFEIEEGFVNGRQEWRELYLKTHLYLAFESPFRNTVYNLHSELSIDIGNLFVRTKPSYPEVTLDRNEIWSYVDIQEIKNIKDINEYYRSESAFALDLLVSDGDQKAFNLYYDLVMTVYKDTEGIIHSLIPNVNMYLNSLGYEGERRKHLFSIGDKWEKICFEIAEYLYGNVAKHPLLPNKKIPDLLPEIDGVVKEGHIVKKAPLLIECKKSLYFTESISTGKQELFKNPTVKSYLPHCRQLEFWILEHSEYDDYSSLSNGTITYKFAEDFLKSDLPDKIKKKITRLLNTSQKKHVSDEWKLKHKEDYLKIEELKKLRPYEFNLK